MSANDDDQTIRNDGLDLGDGEGKFDEVINQEDLLPIKLGRPRKQGDEVDARGDVPLPLPDKTHKVIPAFQEYGSEQGATMSAAAILGFNEEDTEQHMCQFDDEQVHGASESVKAFFGTTEQGSEPSFGYSMKHERRGCFLIFNHMHFEEQLELPSRNGTDEDKKNLAATAKKLGFEYVKIFDDLDRNDVLNWVNKVANADHSKYDYFAMAVLTHGKEGDILFAKDGEYHVNNITDPFKAKNCPSLAGKPKMFFLQACKETGFDDGAEIGDTVYSKVIQVANKSEKEILFIPNAADFLLAYSAVPGYYAWRHQKKGSWFVQALCKCLDEFGEHLELMQIMTRVNRMVAYDFRSFSTEDRKYHDKEQIPSVVTRLTHEVFFRKKVESGSSSTKGREHGPGGKVDDDTKVGQAEKKDGKLAPVKETEV